MLNVVMLSVIMLNVIMQSVTMYNVVMQSVTMHNVVMKCIIMLNAVKLSVIMHNVIMLSALAPVNNTNLKLHSADPLVEANSSSLSAFYFRKTYCYNTAWGYFVFTHNYIQPPKISWQKIAQINHILLLDWTFRWKCKNFLSKIKPKMSQWNSLL
jgi:hypothetical protein